MLKSQQASSIRCRSTLPGVLLAPHCYAFSLCCMLAHVLKFALAFSLVLMLRLMLSCLCFMLICSFMAMPLPMPHAPCPCPVPVRTHPNQATACLLLFCQHPLLCVGRAGGRGACLASPLFWDMFPLRSSCTGPLRLKCSSWMPHSVWTLTTCLTPETQAGRWSLEQS